MKKTILACACALLLSTGGAFAQMQPAPGGAAHGDVGPGAKGKVKSTNMKRGTTTGMSSGKMMKRSSSAPSSSGNVPGTNNNAGPQPGGK